MLLRLRFKERPGESDNWYWIPAAYDAVDIADGCFTGCKVEAFANMRDLATMPRAPAVKVVLGRSAVAPPRGHGVGVLRQRGAEDPEQLLSVTVSVAGSQVGAWRADHEHVHSVLLFLFSCTHASHGCGGGRGQTSP